MSNTTKKYLYLSGFLIPFVFFSSMFLLAMQINEYNHLAFTVSEIGRAGSPVEFEWRIVNVIVAILFGCFAVSLFGFSKVNRVSRAPAFLIGYFGITTIGYALFNASHPLHNLVGMSQLIGYLTPLVLAISWRKHSGMKSVIRWSVICFILILISITLNLSPIVNKEIYTSGYYGLIQRSLFFIFHGLWCGYLSWFMFTREINYKGI